MSFGSDLIIYNFRQARYRQLSPSMAITRHSYSLSPHLPRNPLSKIAHLIALFQTCFLLRSQKLQIFLKSVVWTRKSSDHRAL